MHHWSWTEQCKLTASSKRSSQNRWKRNVLYATAHPCYLILWTTLVLEENIAQNSEGVDVINEGQKIPRSGMDFPPQLQQHLTIAGG
ncbi:unnamed protein product [Choristocarpus tenellus]